MLNKGSHPANIAKQLHIWSNKDGFFAQLKKMSLLQIGDMLKQLARIDYEIKTGQTKASIAIEQLVLSLAQTVNAK